MTHRAFHPLRGVARTRQRGNEATTTGGGGGGGGGSSAARNTARRPLLGRLSSYYARVRGPRFAAPRYRRQRQRAAAAGLGGGLSTCLHAGCGRVSGSGTGGRRRHLALWDPRTLVFLLHCTRRDKTRATRGPPSAAERTRRHSSTASSESFPCFLSHIARILTAAAWNEMQRTSDRPPYPPVSILIYSLYCPITVGCRLPLGEG